MDDLISRQVAIKKFNERQRKLIYCFGFENDMVKIMDIAKSIIIAIPPAQPEIIRCKNCKHHWTHKCMDSMPIERCDLEQTFYDAKHDFCSLAEKRTDGID